MTRARKVSLGLGVAIFGVAVWFGVHIYRVISRLPEAYAAWDTGELLINYMKTHEGRWPRSWDELGTAMNTEATKPVLHGDGYDGHTYPRSLKEHVAVDGSFDPSHPGIESPVAPLGGGTFSVLWADPNDMVREYLRSRPATRLGVGAGH
jgi:hypothetical protein